jgi:hypothetical protein
LVGLSCHPLNARLGFSQDRRSSGADKEERQGARGGGQRGTAGFQPHLVVHTLHGRPSPWPRGPRDVWKIVARRLRGKGLWRVTVAPRAEEPGRASSSPRGVRLARCQRASLISQNVPPRGWRAAWRSPSSVFAIERIARAPLRRATCASSACYFAAIFYGLMPHAYHRWHRRALDRTRLTRRPTRYSAGGRSRDPRGRNASSWRGVRAWRCYAAISPSVPRLPRAPHLIPPSRRLAKAPLERTR